MAAVSLLDVLVSGRPDRPAFPGVQRYATGGLFATALLITCLAGHRLGRRR
jgi:hypothetical protein